VDAEPNRGVQITEVDPQNAADESLPHATTSSASATSSASWLQLRL